MATDYTVPELVRTARDCFEQGEQATKDQRTRNLKSLRFYNDDQWPQDIKDIRAGTPANSNNGQPAVPARPCITINRVKEPVKQVVNQMRSSDMGAEIVPADDFGEMQEVDDDEIELREGLLRRIQRAPETIDAILWMGSRAAICGEGYMGVMTRYLPGKTFDQEPYVHRFYNQNSVMLDPSHEQPDGSDAEWGIVGTDMPWSQYVAEFGMVAGKKNDVCALDDDKFRALGDEAPGWFDFKGPENKATRICRVVDYYYTVRKTRALCELADGSVYWKDELPPGATPRDTRNVIEKSIKWAKIDGYQELDKGDWAGPDIPIIKCLGEEVHPYDSERRSVGMVSPSAQEANFSGNVMISKMVETIGLAPIAQIMMANGQDEGFEQELAQINTRTFGILHYNQTDAEGKPAPPPSPVPITTQIGPIVTALQFFNESVLSVVGQPSPTLGEVDPSIKTKGGLERLLDQAAHGNSNYIDNLAKSVRRLGVVLNGLFYPLLGQKPGRLARIINGEGESETVMIGERPQMRNVTPGGPMGQQSVKPPKVYRLTKDAKLNINIKVTKNYETRRDQESSMLGDLIGANPEFMTWFGDKFLKNTDIPDYKELAERAKVMLAPPIQAMLAEKESGEPIPPHAQAKLAKAQEVIQQLTEANQQLLKERETDGIKEQAETQRAERDNATKVQIEQIKAQAAIAKQEAVDFFKQQLEEFKAAHARMMQDDEQRHEMALASAEAAQQEKDAEAQRVHDAQMGRQMAEAGELSEQAGHQRTLEQGERGHAQNLEAQAAKPQPNKDN